MKDSFTIRQADIIQAFLDDLGFVVKAKVYEKTGNVAVEYDGQEKDLLARIREFDLKSCSVDESRLESSQREMSSGYRDRFVDKVFIHYAKKIFLPAPVRYAWNAVKSLRYIKEGVKSLLGGKLEVSVLDACAIGVSVIRGDFDTAGSVMFLLEVGDILQEWTHKKSVGDLAKSMALNVGKVWMELDDGQRVLTDAKLIREGDRIAVGASQMIPFDGVVIDGEATINQASLTGESVPVPKDKDSIAYAGTVVEEGEILIKVQKVSGASRYEKVIEMIESGEKLKSAVESRAEHLADDLVPYTFLGTALVWLLTRNVTKTLAVLMVDFSCALKLSMPITVLSAIRDASKRSITVKGGKFLEAFAESDTIVFDKTGTLTNAQPTLKRVVPFCNRGEEYLLKVAACLEEHFPHSIANAVVKGRADRGIIHEEMHSKVEYIVAHGIRSTINRRQVLIGSYHFVFEDEGCIIHEKYKKKFDELPDEYSHLYLAINGVLRAVLLIEDPLRENARRTIDSLRKAGFDKIVMMTGDSERTAASIARRVGVDEYYSEVLPQDKADFVTKAKESGHKVVMVGDGINDSPALSSADVGVAISDGAMIAREVADITIAADDISQLLVLRRLSKAMMARIRRNYRFIVGFNGGLIALGVAGLISNTLSATLHNVSTVAIGVDSMKSYPVIKEEN